MGVDQTLIEGQTYFMNATDHNDKTVIVSCGGWAKQKHYTAVTIRRVETTHRAIPESTLHVFARA